MKERIITALVLIFFLVTIGIIDNKFLTNLVISIITIASLFESKKLLDIEDERVFYFLAILSLISIFISPFLTGVIGVISVAGYVAFYQKDINLVSISIYPFLPLMFLEELYLKSGMKTVFWLIVIISFTDSMAYFIGKNLGNRFIKERFSITSPNKTWEGVIGGVLSGSIIGGLVGMMFYSFFNALMISFFVSVASVFGDLFESFLKRRAGVKDSGNILPGHGGILDRIDGYLFGAPLMLAFIISMESL